MSSAREQMLSATLRIGDILSSVSGNVREFPNDFSNNTIQATLELLDLVKSPNLDVQRVAQLILINNLGPSILQELSTAIRSRPPAEEIGKSFRMDILPPPVRTPVQSPHASPLAKRSRRSKANIALSPSQAGPSSLFPLPEPIVSRTVSQGEASTSSAHSSCGRSVSVSGRLKRKDRD
jgi:hypothetical protein